MNTPRLTDISGEIISVGLEVAAYPRMGFVGPDLATNIESRTADDHRRIVIAAELPFPLVEVRFADLGSPGLGTDEHGMTPVAITVMDEAFSKDERGNDFVRSRTLKLEVDDAEALAFRMEDVPFQFVTDDEGFVGFPPRQGSGIPLRSELVVSRHYRDRRQQPKRTMPLACPEPYKPRRMKAEDNQPRDFWAPFYSAYARRARGITSRAKRIANM